MKTRKTDEIKPCDFCKAKADRYYDAPTIGGAWANMCPKCVSKHGSPQTVQLGTCFVLRDEVKEAASEILQGIELSTMEQVVMDGDRDIECPNCGETRAMEPDASGDYECEGCKSKVRIKCLM